jgi:hypothetical protein
MGNINQHMIGAVLAKPIQELERDYDIKGYGG